MVPSLPRGIKAAASIGIDLADGHRLYACGDGRKYPRYSPAGHNGALVYAKVSYSM